MTISLTSCVTPSNVRGERFRNEALFVQKIHVVAYVDGEIPKNLGKSLSECLTRQFDKRGVEVSSDVQQNALPAEVGSIINTKFSPDATILIRFGKFYSSLSSQPSVTETSDKQNWTATFELLDAESKGLWKGIVQLHRPDMQETSQSVCMQVTSDLINGGVLTLKKSERGVKK